MKIEVEMAHFVRGQSCIVAGWFEAKLDTVGWCSYLRFLADLKCIYFGYLNPPTYYKSHLFSFGLDVEPKMD